MESSYYALLRFIMLLSCLYYVLLRFYYAFTILLLCSYYALTILLLYSYYALLCLYYDLKTRKDTFVLILDYYGFSVVVLNKINWDVLAEMFLLRFVR